MDKTRRLMLREITEPTVFENFINDWTITTWTLSDWSAKIGDKLLPFRVGTKKLTQVPQWEAHCSTQNLSFQQFIALQETGDQDDSWFYFDYKHLSEWFNDRPELLETVNWSKFGFPERGGKESTLWMSSKGAHTPCHVDTYGCNLVAQISGMKEWILFPPTQHKQMRPTRVPYEESSIYSDINFYAPPIDLNLQGARYIKLKPGEVLFVPNGWWHYVETVSSSAISINTWIPLTGDEEKQVKEAIVKLLVSAVARLSPNSLALLNPNEVELLEDASILDYLKRALAQIPEESKVKRMKLDERTSTLLKSKEDKTFESEKNDELKMSTLKEMTVQEFSELMKVKRDRFGKSSETFSSEENSDFRFCKTLINTLCDNEALSMFSQKLSNLDIN